MSDANRGDFFVMLTTQDGNYTPLELCTSTENGTSELAKFETQESAEKAASGSVLGDAFGYEVFETGNGC